MAAYITPFKEPSSEETITEFQGEEMKDQLPPMYDKGGFVDSVFTYGMTWSIGAIGDQSVRSDFSEVFRHYAYDMPLLMAYNSLQGGADLTTAKCKFGTATVKINDKVIEQIKIRAQKFQENYKRTFPFGKFIWRLEKQLQFQEKKQAKDPNQLFHDFCIQKAEPKNIEPREKQTLTPLVIAEQKEIEWQYWNKSQYTIDIEEFKDINTFCDTIVPTPDVISLLFVVGQLSKQNYPILLAGPSGSGKTSIAKKLVETQGVLSVKCVLTAQTTSSQLRAVVDTKIERKRKGIYCFPKGQKAIFYVDDAHMPAKEQYGAQPPLEVLRQLFEDQGWYDITTGIFKKIVNMSSIIGCTTSSNQMILPERLMHHLTLVSIPENSDDAFKMIFSHLLQPITKISGQEIVTNVVDATILLYREICKEFKPTPAHSHYVFGPRDLSKIFQGILLLFKNANTSESAFKSNVQNQKMISGLWVHECQRVFGDRLINLDDLSKFNQHLSVSWASTEQSLGPLERMVPEGSFNSLQKLFDINFGMAIPANDCYYNLLNINDQSIFDQVQELYSTTLQKFNKSPQYQRMDLILFKYAIQHLIRITRILQIDRGHGLLIGMPSSGKRSLSRLAFMSLETFMTSADKIISKDGMILTDAKQVQIFEPSSKSDFLDTVRKTVIHCGQNAQPGLLLIQEALTDNFSLECLNFLISLGEIPNLYNNEDTKLIMKSMEDQIKEVNDLPANRDLPKIEPTKQYVFELISQRVLRNLHIIIVCTPSSAALDRIVTNFPSLLGSLTVNWFTQWEIDTLKSIAQYYLKTDPDAEKIVQVLVQIHTDSEKIINSKYSNLCTSPATFLSLITQFKELQKQQTKILNDKLLQYQTGVQKMEETDTQVKIIQQQQQELQPVLLQKQQQVRKLQMEIEEKKKQMIAKSEELGIEEAKALKAKEEADQLAAECKEEVAKAMPIKIRAERALNALKNEDVQIMRKMLNPPEYVKIVMECCCVILRAKMTPGADNWNAIKQQFSNPKILQNLKDIKSLNPELAELLKKFYYYKESFQPQVIQKASVPAAGLCEWIRALYDYYVVMLDIQPKIDKEAEAQKISKQLAEALAIQQAELKKAKDSVAQLEEDGLQKQNELKKLNDQYQKCCDDLQRAEQLISGLAGESKRWKEQVGAVQIQIQKITPYSLIATAYCAQLGGFELVDRNYFIGQWTKLIIEKFHTEEDKLEELEKFQLDQYLYDVPTISQWLSKGLGKDSFSLQSAAIVMNAVKVPLILDPQGQARIWASNCLCNKTARYTDQNLTKQIKEALTNGYSLIIEQISSDEFLRNDARIKAAIIAHNKLHLQNLQSASVTYSDGKEIEVPNTFKLCLITTFDVKIPPDTFNDFSVVTFKTTKEALQDLLVNQAVICDDKKSEEQRIQLTAQIAQMQGELLKNEKMLLNTLVNTQGSPVENVALIDLVKKLSAQSIDVKRKMEKAVITQKENEEKRSKYKELAQLSSCLFFVLLRLINLDLMYDTSLQNFIKIFNKTMNDFKCEPEQATQRERLMNINQTFAERLYATVSRGLFVHHKLSFSLDIALSMQITKNLLTSQQFEIIIACCAKNLKPLIKENHQQVQNKFEEFKVTEEQWENFVILCETQAFKSFNLETIDIFKGFFSDIELEKIEPLEPIEYFLFCTLMKESQITFATKKYIDTSIGQKFTNTQSPQLMDICNESVNTIPTLILLSADSDPSNQLVYIGDSLKMKVHFISMGRGQGVNAEKAINEAVKEGGWVVLGNTHLAGTWLQKLESIIEAIGMETYDPLGNGKIVPIHEQFRLYLTTMPMDGFPSSIIRQATKVSAEAPMGVKNNFIRLWQQLDPEDMKLLSDAEIKLKPEKQPLVQIVESSYKKYLWNLTTFFATVLERRRFGPIGFSTSYDWADPDYIISKMQLYTIFKNLLNLDINVIHEKLQNSVIALRFLISEINVGGRVADNKDQLIVNSLMNAYYQESLEKLGEIKQYEIPDKLLTCGDSEQYLEYVKQNWSESDIPELFGLDRISIIISKTQKGKGLLQTILKVQSSSGGSEQSSMMNIDSEYQQISQIVNNLPQKFNLLEIGEKYATNYYECMNTVLVQECTRYNNLLQIIISSLKATQNALKGLTLKTQQTDAIRQALKINQVPEFWLVAGWPTVMNFTNWLEDLTQRFAFIQQWTSQGKIEIIWFSGFFYPQAFITGVLQNYARKAKQPIDKLALDFQLTESKEKSESEYIINGLFLQGAALDGKFQLIDSFEPFCTVPYIRLTPKLSEQLKESEKITQRYKCPVYRTTVRKGVLTTTGHSSNYIFDVFVNTQGGESTEQKIELCEKWVRRGAAMFQQKE